MRTILKAKMPRRFWRDAKGSAAIEFGFLAPLLMLMLLGTVELGRAINTNRHFVSATASAGDLVAREEYLGSSAGAASSNLASMMLSIKHLMQPYDANSLKLAVFSVKASNSTPDKGKVQWNYSYNSMPVPAKCSDYTLPEGLVPLGGSIIVVDATYNFKSLFGSYIPGIAPTMNWKEKSYHSPRNSCVDYVKGDNCISPC